MVTGALSAILDSDGNILAATGWQDICTRFHRVHPETCKRCRESDLYIKAHLPGFTGEYLDYKCQNGLRDVAVPIIIAGEHLATFFTGQFFYDDDKPDVEYFRAQAQEFGFDEESYLEALSRVPVFTKEQIRNIMNFYQNLVQILVDMGLKNLELAQEVKERKQAEKEASFFRTLIEKTSDPTYVIDPEDGWRMVYVNQAACSHFGMDRETMLSMRIPDWDPVFDMGKIDTIRQQIRQNTSIRFETLHRVASGELVPVEVTANYLVHDGKELNAGYFHDITERKKAEKEILRLNQLYTILSEVNQAIVRSVDQHALFQEICRVIVEYGGFRLAWIGLMDEESGIVKPVASTSVKAGFLNNIRVTVREEPEGMGPTGSAIRKGKLQIVNNYLSNPRTSPWHEEAEKFGYNSVAAIALKLNRKTIGALTIYGGEKHYFHGQMSGLLLQLAADISFALDNLDREARRKEAERALKKEIIERLQALEALHEKDQLFMQQSRQAAMGEMINNIAHQWRQPLNVIAITIQDLMVTYEDGECSDEYVNNTVKLIMNQVLHMSQTIDDFRNFLKPDQEIKQFNLREAVKKTLVLVGDSFKSQNITIDTEVQEDLIVTGYQNEYCQALLNILNNARDVLTERKIVSPRIQINLFREGFRNVTTISDNAGGIPDEIIDRIFEPYFTCKDADKGTGIGLHITKTIIEKRMNGTISVRNTDRGAEFRIEV